MQSLPSDCELLTRFSLFNFESVFELLRLVRVEVRLEDRLLVLFSSVVVSGTWLGSTNRLVDPDVTSAALDWDLV